MAPEEPGHPSPRLEGATVALRACDTRDWNQPCGGASLQHLSEGHAHPGARGRSFLSCMSGLGLRESHPSSPESCTPCEVLSRTAGQGSRIYLLPSPYASVK